jgi:cation transport regulator ChaB
LHEATTRTTTQDEIECVYEERLTRSGLSRQCAESRAKFNSRVIDDAKPGDVQLKQHWLFVSLTKALSKAATQSRLSQRDHVQSTRLPSAFHSVAWRQGRNAYAVDDADRWSLAHDVKTDDLISGEHHTAINHEMRSNWRHYKSIKVWGEDRTSG